jgi:general secretion pathway protein D
VRYQLLRPAALLLALVLVAGCATGRAIRGGDAAAERGDWDSAVAFYRDAYSRAQNRVDLKIKLERATQNAAAFHMRRARDLEAQDQLPGAAAEYRKAADVDPTNVLAIAKYRELERRMREAAEASRPPARIDTLRTEAAQTSPIRRLDPRAPVPRMSFQNAAVRDLLKTVSDLTNINVTYDRGLEGQLSAPYSLDVTEMPLEDVLNQILSANQLTYKVINPRTIFVYQDTQQKRIQFDDQFIQHFYLSHADPAEVNQQITQMLAGLQPAVRPVVAMNKTVNSLTIKATAPVMEVLASLIRSMDKPLPAVLIEAEILEVNRNFIRQLGLDLNQWALGFTFSPEVAPPLTSGTFPPASPPPFNLNTVSGGISAADLYATSPTALIRLLESNTDTKVLARPQILGRAGQSIQLRLGDQVPIPQTVFSSAGAGGVPNIPTTQVTYQAVGVNLLFTPKVTYQDEIILDQLTLEKSGLGPNLDIGGQTFPTIISRTAVSSLHLRDGESTLIAGLFRDDDRKTISSLPGLSKLPILGQIFGNTNRQIDQTDLVMIITPHIVRSHELNAADLRPLYIGTGSAIGLGTPQLLSEDALAGTSPAAPAGAAPVTTPGTTPGAAPLQSPATNPPATSPGAPGAAPTGAPGGSTGGSAPAGRAPGIVPIEAVPSGAPGSAPAASPVRISIGPPPGGPGGTVAPGSGPFALPIQIANATDVANVTLTITYNPGVLTTPVAGQGGTGSFMRQGDVTPTFGQGVNPDTGRIDMGIARPGSAAGASGSGIIGAVSFVAGTPGTSPVNITGVVTTRSGQSVPVEFTSTTVVVK